MVYAFGQHFGGKVLKLADLFVYLDLGPEERDGATPIAVVGDIALVLP